MKSLKVIVASLILAVGVIAFSAFKADSYDSGSFVLRSYIFATIANDDVRAGEPDQITQAEIMNTANWTLTSSNPTLPSVCNPTNFLCAIQFDDSQYTLAQALAIVYNYFTANGSLPHNVDVDPSANVVKVFRNNIDN